LGVAQLVPKTNDHMLTTTPEFVEEHQTEVNTHQSATSLQAPPMRLQSKHILAELTELPIARQRPQSS
jgi:hypothetical protein